MEKDDIIAFLAKVYLFIVAVMVVLILLSSPSNPTPANMNNINDGMDWDVCKQRNQHG